METLFPVLMYHAVTPAADHQAGHVHISLAAFAAQMQWLHDNGYETITVAEIGQQKHTSAKKVILTFDDGYYSLYELVTPLLKQYRFSATLFLTTASVGAAGYDVLPHFEKEYPAGDRPLTWDELKEMEHSCWDIQAHGHRHLVHNAIATQALQAEISQSKKLIEYHLDKMVEYYAFPYGRYDGRCLEITRQTGFKHVFTVQPGLVQNINRFRLPRVMISRDLTLAVFMHKMETGYSDRRERLKWLLLRWVYRNIKWKDRIRRIYRKFKK